MAPKEYRWQERDLFVQYFYCYWVKIDKCVMQVFVPFHQTSAIIFGLFLIILGPLASNAPVCFNQLRSPSKSQFRQFMPELQRRVDPGSVRAPCVSPRRPIWNACTTVAPAKASDWLIHWERKNRLMWRARPHDQTCLTLMLHCILSSSQKCWMWAMGSKDRDV